MVADVVTIDAACPGRAFERCRTVIRSGGVIVYPTDTFYGLGVDPRNPAAVRKLFEIKGRQADQPILLLLHDRSWVQEWTQEITGTAEALMTRHWPGPLTLVFTARRSVLPELMAGTGQIGLRVPGNDLTRRLLAFVGTALTGTSANLSGGPSPQTAAEVIETLKDRVDLILDAGRTPGGKPSSVVDVSTSKPLVIREGAIPSRVILDRNTENKKRA